MSEVKDCTTCAYEPIWGNREYNSWSGRHGYCGKCRFPLPAIFPKHLLMVAYYPAETAFVGTGRAEAVPEVCYAVNFESQKVVDCPCHRPKEAVREEANG